MSICCLSLCVTGCRLMQGGADHPSVATRPYQAFRYGLFIHWVSGDNQSGTSCGLVKPDGSASRGIEAYCNELNIDKVVDDIAALGFEIVYVTDFHGLGTTLHPSAAVDSWRGKGVYTASRDALGELIAKLKARGIYTVIFTHPLDGHDYGKAQQELLGWNDPTDHFKRWNDFVNDVYADLASRYGKDIVGIGFDSAWGNQAHEMIDGKSKLDQLRLRETLKKVAPTVPLISLSPPNQTTDLYIREVWRPYWFNWDRFEGIPQFTQPEKGKDRPVLRKEDYDTDLWPAYNRPPAVVITDHWTVLSKRDKSTLNVSGEAMFRYTVLQHGASYNGPAVLWSVSPYVTGEWPIDVYEQFMVARKLMAPIQESLRGTYLSTSFITPEGKSIRTLTNGFVATRKPDHTVEYIHVLRPPSGKVLVLGCPADGKVFDSKGTLLPGGATVKVTRQGSSYSVTLGEGSKWDPLDTVIRLKVRQPPRENVALYKPVYFSSSDETTKLQANAFWHAGLTDGKVNKAWSSKDKIDVNHPQWVTVDLLNQQSISRVTLWAYDEAYPVDFTVEVSTDNKTFQGVAKYTSQSPKDGSAGTPRPTEIQVFSQGGAKPPAEPVGFQQSGRCDSDFSSVSARYVRVTATRSHGDTGLVRLQELEVYR